MGQDALDLGLVPRLELNNGPGCEGGEHGERVPASGELGPGREGTFIAVGDMGR
jgi:hypothetical protein